MMKNRSILAACAVIAISLQPAWSASEGNCCPEKALPGAVWEKADATELARWDVEGLLKARQYSGFIHTTTVMIVQCGRVVEEWGPTDEKLYLASVVKSLLSALYGIYSFEGKIPLDRTIGEIGIDDLTPLTTEEKQATVRHLLMARSGVYLPAEAETEEMEQARPTRGSHAPGSYWYYNNWDFNALGTILTVFTGRDVYSAFIERIAKPIGMQDFGIGDYRYWYRTGTAFPHYYANMTARDLARFGLLFLREGSWGSQQIVPAEWVRESTTTHSFVRASGLLQADRPTTKGYGYMWWTGPTLLPHVRLEKPGFAALGVRGQALVVIPEKDLVIVHLTDFRDSTKAVSTAQMGNIISDVINAAPSAECHE